MQELEVYSMVGTEGFTRLVAAFLSTSPARRPSGAHVPGDGSSRRRAAPPRFPDRSVRRAADVHRTKRPSTPPRAAFSVLYKSGCPRSMDALDGSCFWGSCAAGRGRASPSEIPRRNVELYDQSGRALSPLAQSNAPCCPDVEEFLKTILSTSGSCSIYDLRNVSIPTETASGSHPCCVVSVTYDRTSCFHGGNTGSKPVRDANPFQSFARIYSEIHGTSSFWSDHAYYFALSSSLLRAQGLCVRVERHSRG
jgi:hypothetical protein